MIRINMPSGQLQWQSNVIDNILFLKRRSLCVTKVCMQCWSEEHSVSLLNNEPFAVILS